MHHKSHRRAARALDKYFEQRQKDVDADPAKAAAASAAATNGVAADIDARLEAIVERMIRQCCTDGQWQQALGICVEARRLEKLEAVARESPDLAASLRHILKAAQVPPLRDAPVLCR